MRLLAYTDAGFIAVTYVVVLAGLGAYAFRLVRTGRRMSSQVDPERRRWGS